jgi:LCP family protein required for cell wall assembly
VLWILIGVFSLAIVTVAGFYVWFRLEVGASNSRVDPEIVEALEEDPTSTTLAPADASSPSTTPEGVVLPAVTPEAPTGSNIVLLGSDTRSSSGVGGRSDTIILVHVDPEQDYLSVLSIPRDLRVTVPGHGVRKINAAYAYGGAALLIRTIQSEFGIDLDHYVRVDFTAFKEITDALGGVYVDVDRTYDDGRIQLSPGYQLLNGQDALRFCRTRHDRNIDFGRMERQQRFLSAVREQAMGWNLAFKLPSLIDALFSNVDTDLSAEEIIRLAYWAVNLEGNRTRMDTIVASTGTIDGVSYVLASDAQIAAAAEGFLTAPRAAAPGEAAEELPALANAVLVAGDLAGISVNVVNGTGNIGQGALAAVWLLRQGATIEGLWDAQDPAAAVTAVAYPVGRAEAGSSVAQSLGIVTVVEDSGVTRVTVVLGPGYGIGGEQLAAAPAGAVLDVEAWRSLGAEAAFRVVAPTYLPPNCGYSYRRTYSIQGEGESWPAVRVGYRFGREDQYFGVSETTWLDAPIASPGDEIQGPDAVFTVVGSSTKVDHVWWVSDGVLCWVSNTLLYEYTREQLLAVALSATRIPATGWF